MTTAKLYPALGYRTKPGFRFCLGTCNRTTHHKKETINETSYESEHYKVTCDHCKLTRYVCA